MNIIERMKDIIQKEAQAVASIQVNHEFERAVLTMNECKGKILTTGIGKAGYIARKFAATLCSTCTPAAFIHPGEAAHGDLGLVDHQDCIIAFSTSGKSNEVIEMLELSRHLNLNHIIGITSHPDSELRKVSEIILDMGVVEEACPLGLTPTTSLAVMLAISDALAIALMELKGVGKKDFGLRHHGGYLGRRARTDNIT
ncbi:MAG: SIS domain-containing protein [Candidatus Hinthialibacter antarcticus]|nr:SIS domain-containing protein [Candidatus Hinthialibacter antarcticus]